MKYIYILFLLLSSQSLFALCDEESKPNILFVIVDDLGFGDVGFNRVEKSAEVITPNMDKLVDEGIHLTRHMVHPECTPSRSSFYSGRLPAHVQPGLCGPCSKDCGLDFNMTGIAEKMKLGGYKTHHVGKWDAGMETPTHTPKGRGFDTSLNYFGHGNWAWTEIEWAN